MTIEALKPATLPPHSQRRAMSLDDFAQECSVSGKTMRREADAGHLKTVKIRGRRMVLAEDAVAYLNSLSGASAK